MYSGGRDRNSKASRRDQRQGTDGMLMSEKFRCQLRSQNINQAPTMREEQRGMECTETDAMAEETVLCENYAEHRRERRRETDAGARLAGGRAGEIAILEDLDQYSVSEGSTLPPAYSSHFGNR
ncbi:hypothetical protein GSI_08571 [Ganoderma sinense ZZ0214-1]|uniref:Uncharacterized protein n=1 Tax=Ganoderma sinense ZZ0214-1 TaxID=1077348 RepID=A0A2G8S421_9APHY|nr:hypothetical protein GSI_08571 [Ganoderma sinense ZZ0214-1]